MIRSVETHTRPYALSVGGMWGHVSYLRGPGTCHVHIPTYETCLRSLLLHRCHSSFALCTPVSVLISQCPCCHNRHRGSPWQFSVPSFP